MLLTLRQLLWPHLHWGPSAGLRHPAGGQVPLPGIPAGLTPTSSTLGVPAGLASLSPTLRVPAGLASYTLHSWGFLLA